jgi:hypothetical protein
MSPAEAVFFAALAKADSAERAAYQEAPMGDAFANLLREQCQRPFFPSNRRLL